MGAQECMNVSSAYRQYLQNLNFSHALLTYIIKSNSPGAPFSSIGRALQRPQVWVPAWGPLLRVTPPLSQSCNVLSVKPKWPKKIYLKKKPPSQNEAMWNIFCGIDWIGQDIAMFNYLSVVSGYSQIGVKWWKYITGDPQYQKPL